MITKDELNSIGYVSNDNSSYVVPGEWEYEFNIKTQELWHINDGFGDPEFLCKVTDFEKLKDLLNILPK
jgi:hypothetical protein